MNKIGSYKCIEEAYNFCNLEQIAWHREDKIYNILRNKNVIAKLVRVWSF